MKKKNIIILGSTGSIGRNALHVIRNHSDRFHVVGLSANQNVDLLREQIRSFAPKYVALGHTAAAEKLTHQIRTWKRKPLVLNHTEGMERLAAKPEADFVVCAMVGAKGLLPLVAALKKGKTVGLANKEALVIAGDIIMALSRRYRAPIIPIDSEHSAIFQCIEGHNRKRISRIILTASGGPFYRSRQPFDQITAQQALNHPTWKMGNKITVDSATLMNKGLEAIEAHHLFGVPMEKISIVIHPQSIVHSMVEFEDGSNLAQLSHPDMRIPIQYALTYPDRYDTPVRRLHLDDVKRLEFDKPDFSRFPCLRLALQAGREGGTRPAVLNAANEEAVHAFIGGKIKFTDIARIVGHVLRNHSFQNASNLEKILKMDEWARHEALKIIRTLEKS